MINFELQLLITILAIVFLVLFNKYHSDLLVKTVFFGFVLVASLSNYIFFSVKYSNLLSFSIFLLSVFFFFNNYRMYYSLYLSSELEPEESLRLISKDSIVYTLPIIGLIILVSVIYAEIFYFDGTFSEPSYILILLALSLILYSHVDGNFNKEFDFVLVFLISLSILYVLPHTLLKIYTSSMGETTINPYEGFMVETFLGMPVVIILKIFGFIVWADGERIFYIDNTTALSTSVFITTGCSGLHTVLIFLCSCSSYFFIERNRFSFSESSLFLILGVLIAYLANLFRMSMIIAIGHFYGSEALKFAHANLGWIIFTFWIFLFFEFLNRLKKI